MFNGLHFLIIFSLFSLFYLLSNIILFLIFNFKKIMIIIFIKSELYKWIKSFEIQIGFKE